MKKHQVLLIVSSAVLVFGFFAFSLEKLRVTNFYQKPVQALTVSEPRPLNDVDYTPQTSPPDPTINSVKNPGEASTNPPQSNVSLTIVRTNQDTSTKNLTVSALVDGTSSGTCKLELLQGTSVVVTKTASITEQSGLNTCAGFTVMADEIPVAGTYAIKVSVGDISTSTSKELTK